jgi:hypothetical protein
VQRRYAVAILVGTAVGLFAIASQAIDPWWLWTINLKGWQPCPNLDLSLSSNLWDWQLPDWDGPHLLQSAQRTKLIEQAYFLKACHLFLEQGLTYLAIPSAISCAYVKLDQISRHNEVVKDFVVSSKVSFGCFVFFSGTFTLAALISAFNLPGNWELRLLDVWRTFVFFYTTVFPFVVPPLTMLGFAILFVTEGRLKRLCCKTEH